ncbi:gibberellin A4 carboxyl methyltransferase [Salvia divinorum]|uniref:Gibberellin A4 carboxyl methyltransferase n=1 Tax=Salvia divinorum TaxID=28513 RepID=A0ABD1GCE2_SALDI
MGETFPMNGGDGDYSYTKNSQYQKRGSDSVKEMIQQAVSENLDTKISSTVAIADLGCSVGPNTFFTVENLIEAVQKKHPSKTLEFQVFFNDHSGNDFNTLFSSLPPERHYHAAGVPGSFHDRLFPRSSITVAHSSYAIHWLSKQPQGAPNEGRIHCLEAPEAVLRAYSDQYEKDLGDFVSARGEEIVTGGLVLLVFAAAPDGIPHSENINSVLFSYLGHCLMELANEGVVEKKKIDEFNLPLYYPTEGEVRRVIERNGCFSVVKMEMTYPYSEIKVRFKIGPFRAALEGVLIACFGNSVVEKVFSKMQIRSDEIVERLMAVHDFAQLFVVLKRK